MTNSDLTVRGSTIDTRSPTVRWLTLLIVCLGTFMAISDIYIIYVALPTIQADLALSERDIIWLVNAYTVFYGGLLLLCGRLGDCYGHHRVFLLGTVAFTVASLGCGLARSLNIMVSARAIQGAAAAAMSVASLSSVAQEFERTTERAWAVAIYSCVQAVGSSAGLLLGGILTRLLSWRWMFLINLPLGITVCLLARAFRLNTSPPQDGVRPRVLSLWMPLTLFRNRQLLIAAAFGALRAGALAIWAIIYAFYLQRVLRYDALELGMSFLPYTLTMAMFSLGLSDKLILRFGAKALMSSGAALMVIALLVMSRLPLNAIYPLDVFPAMVLLGLGNGMTTGPFLMRGLSTVGRKNYGMASAVLNSSILLAATVALALVAGHAPEQPRYLAATATGLRLTRAHSYSIALVVASLLVAGAVLVSLCPDERRHATTSSG